MLDSGSQQSFITESVAQELSLSPERKQTITATTFGSREEHSYVCECVRVNVALKNGQSRQLMLFTIPLISEPLLCQPVSLCQDTFDHLTSLDLADNSDGHSRLQVDILVGSDQYWNLTTGEIRRGDSGPVAIETELGWVLSGPAPTDTPAVEHSSLANIVTCHALRIDAQLTNDRLHSTLKKFWELESLGVGDDDKSVLADFSKSITFNNGRYEVFLPWKEAHPELPDNRLLSLRRLRGLLCRLRQTPALLKVYDALVKDQLSRGIVEVVNKPEEQVSGEIHYVPHHAVIRVDKETTKLRVVYDASARGNGPSLNNCLYSGPKFNQRIMDILLRL